MYRTNKVFDQGAGFIPDKVDFSLSKESQQDTVGEPTEAIPEYPTEEEQQDAKLWRTVIIGEQEHRIDMKCIGPYQRVISHGGEAVTAGRQSGDAGKWEGKSGVKWWQFCLSVTVEMMFPSKSKQSLILSTSLSTSQ